MENRINQEASISEKSSSNIDKETEISTLDSYISLVQPEDSIVIYSIYHEYDCGGGIVKENVFLIQILT